MDTLRISSDLKGKSVTQPSITGYGQTKEEAMKSMKRLQSILRSGSLPVPIEIVSIDKISPRLGSRFVSEALTAGVVSILLISLLVLIYYKDPIISLPVIISSFSEVLMVIGFSVLINWTIDLASIAGILASIGASITDQVMMIDELESGKKEKLTLKERIKRALFIIFGSAGISAVSMVPLLFTGYGILRGFAVTTWLGLAVSNLISRPAFNDVVEILVSDRKHHHAHSRQEGPSSSEAGEKQLKQEPEKPGHLSGHHEGQKSRQQSEPEDEHSQKHESHKASHEHQHHSEESRQGEHESKHHKSEGHSEDSHHETSHTEAHEKKNEKE